MPPREGEDAVGGAELGDVSLPKNTSNGGVILQAENIVEKLKILNYDLDVVYRKDQTLFTRTFFAEPAANANGQWVSFVMLVSWLMGAVGNDFSVDKYDDPNTSANKMMLALKKIGFEPDFPVTRLKQAYGESVCNVLDFLADKALKKQGFKFREPAYPETDGFEEAEVDEDADLGQTDIIDEAIESEEEEVLFSEHVRSASTMATNKGSGFRSYGNGSTGDSSMSAQGGEEKEVDSQLAILQNEVSPEFQAAWQAELERVTPRLKRAGLQGTGNEWRAHLEQTIKHNTMIQEILPSCTKQLNRINEDLTASLERIQTKEAALGGMFETIARDYKGVQETLKMITTKYETTNETVEKLSNELSTVTEALEELKDNMDSRGNSMVDTSPLQKIRKALTKIKAEIKQMELRIGVVGHSLLQGSLRAAHDLRSQKRALASGSSKSASGSSSNMPHSPRQIDDLSPRSPEPAYM